MHTTSNKIKGSSASGTIYRLGNKRIDGSVRFSSDDESGITVIEKYIDGVWNPTSFKAGPKSVYVGERVAIAAAGHHIITEDVDGHAHFHGHSMFDGQLSTTGARILTAYNYTERHVAQPDNTGSWTGTTFDFLFPSAEHVLVKKGYFQTGTMAATSPVRIKIWEGTDDTGLLSFNQLYPTNKFAASSEVSSNLDGYIEYGAGENYFFRVESEEDFSLKTNAAGTLLWLAVDQSYVHEDDMLQTTEWISGGTFIAGQLSVQNKQIYVCNTTGIQTGTFASNVSSWDLLTDSLNDQFSYEKIIAGKTVTIPENQQMALHSDLILDGILNLDGTLAIRT
ncbi:MAG: hypothetical protein GY861_28360 [bacterium]|nr:hypothetical protein [bacterium]